MGGFLYGTGFVMCIGEFLAEGEGLVKDFVYSIKYVVVIFLHNV